MPEFEDNEAPTMQDFVVTRKGFTISIFPEAVCAEEFGV